MPIYGILSQAIKIGKDIKIFLRDVVVFFVVFVLLFVFVAISIYH